jgi:hypothetical protein
MSLVYLKGSDVEIDIERQRARLLSIDHETYVYHCNQLGNVYYPNCNTKYCFELKEKMEAALDENDEPILDGLGQPMYNGLGEFCLEIDTEQDEYDSLPSVHVNRLISREAMESDGWFVNE